MGSRSDGDLRIYAARRILAFVHSLPRVGDGCERNNVNEKSKIIHDDSDRYGILKEGEAEIRIRGNDVFYNKAQVDYDLFRIFVVDLVLI